MNHSDFAIPFVCSKVILSGSTMTFNRMDAPQGSIWAPIWCIWHPRAPISYQSTRSHRRRPLILPHSPDSGQTCGHCRRNFRYRSGQGHIDIRPEELLCVRPPIAPNCILTPRVSIPAPMPQSTATMCIRTHAQMTRTYMSRADRGDACCMQPIVDAAQAHLAHCLQRAP